MKIEPTIALQKVINDYKQLILSSINHDEIRSLYLGGTILSADRNDKSDLDFFGIAYDSFKIDSEKQINKILTTNYANLNIEAKLRVIYWSEMTQGIQRGFITTLIPVKLLIKRLPHFIHLWGIKIDITETIGPYNLEEEILIQIGIIQNYITQFKNSCKNVPFSWIPKGILYLASIEAELYYSYPYTTSFSQLKEYFISDKNHITHKALTTRNNKSIESSIEMEFIELAISYINELQNRLL